MDAGIEWIDVATRARRPVAPPGSDVLCSSDLWRGIVVQHLRCPASEWPEGYVPYTVASLLLGGHCVMQSSWPGHKRAVWTAPPNCIFICPARMPFTHTNFGPTEAIQVAFMPERLGLSDVSVHLASLRPVVGGEDFAIAQLLRLLDNELRAGCAERRLYAESLGVALAMHLVSMYGSSPDRPGGRAKGLSPQKLQLVEEYIDAHLGVDFGLSELARLTNLNVDYFIRAFKRRTGVSPHKFVLMKRIERAKALARIRTIPLAEIAQQCGFGAQSSFIRAFKTQTRMTPREYRHTL